MKTKPQDHEKRRAYLKAYKTRYWAEASDTEREAIRYKDRIRKRKTRRRVFMLKLQGAPKCPKCGTTVDGISHPTDSSARPSPGDFSVCLYCQTLMVFTDDLDLRAPTPEEEAEVLRHPDAQAALLTSSAFRAMYPDKAK